MVIASATETIRDILAMDHMGWILIGVMVTICSVFKTVASMVKSTAREKTRREIAAFIAEGSMTPEQGERLMTSGEKDKTCC
jgi:hypothetical protein